MHGSFFYSGAYKFEIQFLYFYSERRFELMTVFFNKIYIYAMLSYIQFMPNDY